MKPGWRGYHWVKWVQRIDVSRAPRRVRAARTAASAPGTRRDTRRRVRRRSGDRRFGSSTSPIWTIASPAVARSRYRPAPIAAQIALPIKATSVNRGTLVGKPVTSALIWFHSLLCACPPHTRSSSIRVPRLRIASLNRRSSKAVPSSTALSQVAEAGARRSARGSHRARYGSQSGERSPQERQTDQTAGAGRLGQDERCLPVAAASRCRSYQSMARPPADECVAMMCVPRTRPPSSRLQGRSVLPSTAPGRPRLRPGSSARPMFLPAAPTILAVAVVVSQSMIGMPLGSPASSAHRPAVAAYATPPVDLRRINGLQAASSRRRASRGARRRRR